MKHIKKIFGAITAVLMFSACSTTETPEIKRFNTPRFTDSAPIELKVNKIETVSEFTPQFKAPYIEHLFPIPIEATARTWAKDRLSAVDFSSDKSATFIIKDASVTEEIEKSEKLFYKDRIVYRANLNIVLKVADAEDANTAQTEIKAWRELIIPADASIEEKEKYWNGMANKLFDEFNIKMEESIRQHLNMYVNNNSYIQNYEN